MIIYKQWSSQNKNGSINTIRIFTNESVMSRVMLKITESIILL